MNIYNLYWSPEGRKIATVEAKSARQAIRKAPMPYRKYLGEIYATESGPIIERRIGMLSYGVERTGENWTVYAYRDTVRDYGVQTCFTLKNAKAVAARFNGALSGVLEQ